MQARLLARDAHLAVSAAETGENWLQRWWLEYAYLRWREPSAVNVNWYMVCNNHPAHVSTRPVNRQCRAAGLIYNFTQAYLKILRFVPRCSQMRLELVYQSIHRSLCRVCSEEIPREYARKVPLCMDQLRRIFATARIPDVECDRIETYSGSRHVVVMYHNQVFAFDVLDENNNAIPAEEYATLCIGGSDLAIG